MFKKTSLFPRDGFPNDDDHDYDQNIEDDYDYDPKNDGDHD